MRVAVVQFEPGPEPEGNVDRMVERIRDAAVEGAEFVVLPEVWNLGYFAFDAYEDGAEPLDGPTLSRLADLAAELGIYLHTGSVVERRGEDLHNASALLSPAGERLGVYRKLHLFGYESEESRLLTPGDRVTAIDTGVGTVGLTTCYDLRFPALYRELVEAGVELLLVASAWPQARVDHWQLLTRTRAVECQAFLAAANLAGTNAGTDLAGRSAVVDPWGVVRADAGGGERTAVADVDLDEVRGIREEFPVLDDRRFAADRSLSPPESGG